MAPSIRGRTAASNESSRAAAGAAALASALLFGAAAPAAKVLLGSVDSNLLAGLLYLGAGVTLSVVSAIHRWSGQPIQPFSSPERVSLCGAIFFGGVLAPVLLLWGLARIPAASASLILILEAPLTALGAALLFHEHLGARVVEALTLTTLGAACVVGAGFSGGDPLGYAAVVAACACWALDNNLTREVSGGDAVRIAALKGLAGGTVNGAIALALGSRLPGSAALLAAMGVGAVSYGVSLVLYIRSLRELGAARAGAYFASAPFLGASLSVLVLGERPTGRLAAAAGLMAFGVLRLLGESHSHRHRHESIEHSHLHLHDEHHRHGHPEAVASEPHAHLHRHEALVHEHPHAPDIHHRHGHGSNLSASAVGERPPRSGG